VQIKIAVNGSSVAFGKHSCHGLEVIAATTQIYDTVDFFLKTLTTRFIKKI
jgi:hypothetical protein